MARLAYNAIIKPTNLKKTTKKLELRRGHTTHAASASIHIEMTAASAVH